MLIHEPLRIWQERPNEFSYRCVCGMTMKHQPMGDWPRCLNDTGIQRGAVQIANELRVRARSNIERLRG